MALWAHLKIPKDSHGGCWNSSLGSEGLVPPSMGSHSRDTRMGLGYDWQRCADPLGARTMASIVLILSHPLLGHPEATVRTCLAGQSRNLWNIGGHGLGILTSRGFRLIVVAGSGETESAPERNRPAAWLRVSRGSGATCPGRNRPDITFQGSPFEATRVGSRNDRAVVLWPDVAPHLRN